MDGEIASVIKNLIHIDKNALEIRDKFKNEIENRKKQIEDEIEKLKKEIIDEELKRIEESEKEELDKAQTKAAELIENSKEQCEAMEKKYQDSKGKLISNVFDELFKI